MTINYHLLPYRTTRNKHLFHRAHKPDNINSPPFVHFDDLRGKIRRIVIMSVLPHYILIDDIDNSTHDYETA